MDFDCLGLNVNYYLPSMRPTFKLNIKYYATLSEILIMTQSYKNDLTRDAIVRQLF